MKKIVLVTSSFSKNGVSRNRITLANEFLRTGFAVDFLVSLDEGPLREEVPSKCRVFEMQATRPRDLVRAIGAYLRAEKPDGMIASSWPITGSAIIAKLLFSRKTKLLVSEHSSWPGAPELKNKDKFIIKHFGKIIFSRADCVVGVSRGVADSIAEYTGMDRRMLTVIYNPLRTSLGNNSYNEGATEILDWWSGSKKLLAVGRLAPEKDYTLMLNALAALNKNVSAKLLILGDGGELSKLRRCAEELGIESLVCFAGYQSHLTVFYESADLFVLSSINEGFGNVIIEALSMGLSVVSTDAEGGPAEILGDGEWGDLVAVGDSKAMAKDMEYRLSHPLSEKKLKARAGDFAPSVIAAQYVRALGL